MTAKPRAADASSARTYTAVNMAIAETFFDGRFRLAPLYLDLEGEVLEDISVKLGCNPEDCPQVIADAVAKSLTWRRGNPFAGHLDDLQAWDELGRFDFPPFTALLATLSLAAERMRGDDTYSAHNYYERLFELLGVEAESSKNSLKHNALWMRVLWESLNSWLANNDYEYGRPTAKQVNDWKYASYALSQALVREADRRRLQSLFPEYGLAPRERLTEAEMSIYLHEWMRGGGPSAWLKKIWAVPDLRPRVAAAACSELEAWEGADATEEGGAQRRRLSWAAAFHTFPRREFRMFLAAATAEEERPSALELSSSSSPAALAAFEGCTGGIWLTPSAGEISVLEPTHMISLNALMVASFELRAKDESLLLDRSARAIVPLVKLDTGALYREVSRVSFLRPHLVLCHAEWRDRASTILVQNARAGFQEWDASKLPGVPQDWVLFTGVEMLRAPANAGANMQALVPLSEGVALEFNGGLRLSHNLWHSSAPPEITAAAPHGPVGLKLSDASERVLAQAEWKIAACRLNLAAEDIPDAGDFTVTASLAGKVRREAHLSLRSAAQPRPLSVGDPPGYRVEPDTPVGLISAQPPVRNLPGLFVRGMTFAGASPIANISTPVSADELDPARQGHEETDAEEDAEYKLDRVEGLRETCVLRGHHVWDCEPFRAGDHPSDDKWMVCRDCKNRVLTRNRGSFRKAAPGKKGGTGAAGAQGPINMKPRLEGRHDSNLVLDALCWLGAGPWSRLEDLAANQGGAPWAASRMAAALSELGHIDVTYDPQLRSPAAWIVAPPSIVFCAPDRAFLSGFRNEALISSVRERVEAAGGALSTVDQDDAPDALLVVGLEVASATEALSGLKDHHQRPLAVADGFSRAIYQSAPSISVLWQVMRVVHLEDPKDLHRFEPASGGWRPVSAFDGPGAYRASVAGRRYVYRNAAGECREGSYSLVKLIAARAAGVRLHGYDAGRRCFQSLLGCEPPGLFSRALVAASGLRPRREGGRLVYAGVAPDDAALLLNKLYS